MTGWHAADDLVARYTDGSLPEPDAWSLEKHLESCGSCAARASQAARAGAAGPVLAQVRDAVLDTVPHVRRARTPLPAPPTAPPLPAPPTPAVPASAPPRRARAVGGRLGRIVWAAGPALRGAWTGAVLLVAVGALALAYGGGSDSARPLLLALAPVVPVAGVALSYGRYADPLYELAATSPSGGLRLLLTRTAAVLAVSVPLLTVAGLLLPAAGPRLPQAPAAAAWLLPGLALTLAALALSGYTSCRTGSMVVGGGWLLALAAPVLAAGGAGPASTGSGLTARLAQQLSLYFTGAPAQWGWAAGAALCALLLTARRTAYDRLETM
ncbi:zf-HC2 domain-containing protein [Streptomyces fagopyri]|uniref:Zf-HC2 domain-containing protein n=1 Tax=Streptomyces fagopyri TaxID=2662397 RepID=A0A5Q0LIH3_9ACTN|nr:zf-HC2 domain-containing protein [Streptomyces fagopyri]QFZ76317.1 zf-HC2 domain-containing protein [Streptomyces fagopyri]